MKQKVQIIISAAATSLLACSALAIDTSDSNTDGKTYSQAQTPEYGRIDRLKDTAKVSDIIGMTVQNDQGQKLGKVEDLAVDVESGRIVLAKSDRETSDKGSSDLLPGVRPVNSSWKEKAPLI